MRVIYKNKILPDDTTSVYVSEGSQILSAISQRGEIVVYSLENKDKLREERYEFRTIATGLLLNEIIEGVNIDDYTFLDTVSIYGGELIYHVFYRKVK